jgi:LysM repeat protein
MPRSLRQPPPLSRRRPVQRRGFPVRSTPRRRAPAQRPAAPQAARGPRVKSRRARRFDAGRLAVLGLASSLILSGLCLLLVLAGAVLVYGSGRVLPGVHSVGVDLGGQTEAQAAAALTTAWNSRGIVLRDGPRIWAVSPAELGVSLDAGATAAAAHAWGRSSGSVLDAARSLVGGAAIDPVLTLNLATLTTYLQSAKVNVDVPATNAGVRLVNGQAVASPAVEGRELNVQATVEEMRVNAAGELADGALDLVMSSTQPTITDASPLVAQANALLTSPFSVNGYDPIRDEWQHWVAPPEVWAAWLTAESAPANASGLALTVNAAGPTAFLQANATFGDERYIEVDKTVSAIQQALAQNQTSTTIRIWHGPTTYTVQAGQTLAAIAEEVGIPYPFIQAANPGVNTDALSVGQTLNLPSKDVLVPLDPIPSKRIVVSRSQQHLWAYENGQVVFDWVISTGLPSSPTALGVFQVQTHEPNAYAEQWNLYMPNFLGFYHPGPNMDLINGFHGFPTRGGGYLLWTGDLGHPVTYGCVLLSLQNAEALYNWAQDGVVVEVRA